MFYHFIYINVVIFTPSVAPLLVLPQDEAMSFSQLRGDWKVTEMWLSDMLTKWHRIISCSVLKSIHNHKMLAFKIIIVSCKIFLYIFQSRILNSFYATWSRFCLHGFYQEVFIVNICPVILRLSRLGRPI